MPVCNMEKGKQEVSQIQVLSPNLHEPPSFWSTWRNTAHLPYCLTKYNNNTHDMIGIFFGCSLSKELLAEICGYPW